MLAHGRFIGAPERRSFVWEHRPREPESLAVVICPPLGYHYACSYRTIRTLAENLAGRGHVVVRAEYNGTANAPGTHLDPDRIDAWATSVEDAIALVVAEGAERVCLVGIGFGATLALKAAATNPQATHLVLWDPVVSGRRFSRELAALAMATGETQPEPDGVSALSVVGHRYTNETLAAMKRVDTTKLGVADRSVLIIERPDRDGSEPLVDALREEGCDVTVRHLEGTAALLDTDAELACIPRQILHEIVHWIDAAKSHDAETAVVAEAGARLTALNPTTGTNVDVDIYEEFDRIGPMNLAGMWGSNTVSAASACVIFLNNGVSPSSGPARAWVDMSRTLNRHGWATLRLDTSGLGDSPTRSGFHDDDTHARIVTDDVRDAIDAGRRRGFDEFFLVGLCSGAFNSLEAQLADDRVTGCFAINPILWVTPRRRTCWLAPWWRLFEWPMRKTPLRVQLLRLPRWLWSALGWLRITPPGDLTVRKIARFGRRSTLVYSLGDAGQIDFDKRSLRARDRYRLPASTVDVVIVEDLDHSLFGYGAREKVLALLVDWIPRNAATQPADTSRESQRMASSQ